MLVLLSQQGGKEWLGDRKERKLFLLYEKKIVTLRIYYLFKTKVLNNIMLILQNKRPIHSRLKFQGSLPLLWPSAIFVLSDWSHNESTKLTCYLFFPSSYLWNRANELVFANDSWVWETDAEFKPDFLFGKSLGMLGDQSQLTINYETLPSVKVHN